MEFRISYHWAARDVPHEPPEDFLAELPLLAATLIRFNHIYRGEFHVPLRGGVLDFLLEDDFAIVFDRLPEWLSAVASTESPSPLLFGSQGTELLLVAERRGDKVVVSAQSIDPKHPLSASLQPLEVSARTFFDQWREFVLAVLNALATFEPKLGGDAGWRDYREAIEAVGRSV